MARSSILSVKRNKIINIEQPIESKDSNGVITQTWVDFDKFRASVQPLTGREYYQSKQIADDITTKFNLLYCEKASNITSKMRILYNGKYYDISGPPQNPNEDNREIIIMGIKKNA